jgi:hypothetical protein
VGADLSACDADQALGVVEIDVRKERLPLFSLWAIFVQLIRQGSQPKVLQQQT